MHCITLMFKIYCQIIDYIILQNNENLPWILLMNKFEKPYSEGGIGCFLYRWKRVAYTNKYVDLTQCVQNDKVEPVFHAYISNCKLGRATSSLFCECRSYTIKVIKEE